MYSANSANQLLLQLDLKTLRQINEGQPRETGNQLQTDVPDPAGSVARPVGMGQ